MYENFSHHPSCIMRDLVCKKIILWAVGGSKRQFRGFGGGGVGDLGLLGRLGLLKEQQTRTAKCMVSAERGQESELLWHSECSVSAKY